MVYRAIVFHLLLAFFFVGGESAATQQVVLLAVRTGCISIAPCILLSSH